MEPCRGQSVGTQMDEEKTTTGLKFGAKKAHENSRQPSIIKTSKSAVTNLQMKPLGAVCLTVCWVESLGMKYYFQELIFQQSCFGDLL